MAVTLPTQVATSDATVYGTSPDRVWSNIKYLTVMQGGSGRRAFVYFPRAFPLGSTIVSAKLRLRQERPADVSATRLLCAEPIATKWLESKITWNNAPPVFPTFDAFAPETTGKGVEGYVYEFDVTQMLQAVSDGAPWFGFRITSNSDKVLGLHSRESGKGPTLDVTYSTAPKKPVKLVPSGGRAVSVPRPWLSLDFNDLNDDLAAVRVQTFGGATALSAAATSLRVASFNVNGGYNGNWATRLPQVVDLIDANNPDLVMLQEAHEDVGEHTAILAGLHGKGRTEYDLVVGSGGNHFLINTTVLAVDGLVKRWVLPWNRDLSTVALIHLPSGRKIPVWNTHFIAGDSDKRSDQARALVTILAGLGPVRIGGGDLNNDSAFSGSPLQQLALAGNVEVRGLVDVVTNGASNSHDGYAANPNLGKWIDHLFVSGDLIPTAVGLVDSGSASDHNLIYTDLSMAVQAKSATVTAPSFDSGEVPATTPLFRLPFDVEVGEVVSWRGQTKSSGGEWSPWSDIVSFTRTPKVVVDIVNPAAAPNDFVSEPTPPFSHTVTGASSQVAYRKFINLASDRSVELWDTGKVTSADLTATPTKDLKLVPGTRYVHIVWVYDDVDREATSGDSVVARAEREFTFDLSATVAPVTNLQVAQVDERPWATVTFESATAPDGLVFFRDDVPVQTVLDPVSLLVTGTSYQWVDREASPTTEHVWSVGRVVNGVTSDDNPSVEMALSSLGVWVSSLDGEHVINLSGDRPVSWDADELVDLYRPYGGTRVHVVTQAVFGRAGQVAGVLAPYTGQTFDEAVAAFEALRDRDVYPYGTPMTMTLVDTCTQMFWTKVLRTERDEFYNEIDIRFDFNEIL